MQVKRRRRNKLRRKTRRKTRRRPRKTPKRRPKKRNPRKRRKSPTTNRKRRRTTSLRRKPILLTYCRPLLSSLTTSSDKSLTLPTDQWSWRSFGQNTIRKVGACGKWPTRSMKVRELSTIWPQTWWTASFATSITLGNTPSQATESMVLLVTMILRVCGYGEAPRFQSNGKITNHSSTITSRSSITITRHIAS